MMTETLEGLQETRFVDVLLIGPHESFKRDPR